MSGLNAYTKLYIPCDIKTNGATASANGVTEVFDRGNIGYTVTKTGSSIVLSTDQKKYSSDITSCYFPSSQNHLSVPTSTDWAIIAATTNDVSIDFWFNKPADAGGQYYEFFGQYISSAYKQCFMWNRGWGFDLYIYYNGATYETGYLGPTTIASGWHHVLMYKKGGSPNHIVGFYLDGVQVGYYSSSATAANLTDQLNIGSERNNVNTSTTAFYMSHFRWYAGNPFLASPNVGLTNTISLPTAKYSSDANTKLLLYMDPQDMSGGSNGGTFQNPLYVGTAVTNVGSPFYDSANLISHWPLDDYSASTTLSDSHGTYTGTRGDSKNTNVMSAAGKIGLCQYFDGDNDFLTWTSANIALIAALTNITIAFWIKIDTGGLSEQKRIWHKWDGSDGWYLDVTTSGTIKWLVDTSGGSDFITTTGTVSIGSWAFVVASYNGTTLKVSINGGASETKDHTYGGNMTTNAAVMRFGTTESGLSDFKGWADDLRIFNSAISDTRIASYYANTTQYTILRLDGNSDYISLVDASAWDITTNNYTIDCWVKISALPTSGNKQVIASQYASATSYWEFSILNTSGVYSVQFLWYNIYHNTVTVNLSSLTVSTWNHYAIVKSGNNWYIFFNGVQQGSAQFNSSSVLAIAGGVQIGAYNATNFIAGDMSNIRFQGEAVWTSNFTVPTSAYDFTSTASGTLYFGGDALCTGPSLSTYGVFDSSSRSNKLYVNKALALEVN